MIPDNGYVEKARSVTVTQAKGIQPEMREIAFGNSNVLPDLSDEAVQSWIVDSNVWLHYGANIKAIIQEEIMEETTDVPIDDFHKTNDPSLNGIMYLVGPGNGGGGTYIHGVVTYKELYPKPGKQIPGQK